MYMIMINVLGCFAPCNNEPPTVGTWPLGVTDGVTEARSGDTNGTIGPDVTYAVGPPGVGNSSMQFHGGPDSYVDIRLYNYSEVWAAQNALDLSITMYFYVEDISNGTLFHYKSDTYLPANALVESAIEQFKVFFINGQVYVDYGVNRTCAIAGAVLQQNRWTHMAFSRDVNQGKTTLFIDRNNTKLDGDIAWLSDKVVHFPGHIRIGNSFDTTATASRPLIGRAMCMNMFGAKDPTNFCLLSTVINCRTATIVTTTSSTTSTTTTTTTSTTTSTPTSTSTMTTITSTTEQPATTASVFSTQKCMICRHL